MVVQDMAFRIPVRDGRAWRFKSSAYTRDSV